MIIDSGFSTLLGETRARFDKAAARRQKHLELIQQGRVAEANSGELLEARFARVRRGRGASPASVERGLERVLGKNDLMSVRFLEEGWRKSAAVARIHVGDPQGLRGGYGTGFMVAPNLLLTNHHVLPSADVAAQSRAEFGYQLNVDGGLPPGQIFNLDPSLFFLCDQKLDYALVGIKSTPELAAYGWIRLIEDQGKLLVGEWVNIIQHPNGEPKQLAIRENRVVDELELFLHYQTDTAPGSSGSPVFNDQWEVVALHHSGVPETNLEGDIIALDGQIWQPYMGEHRIRWIANEGVRVSRLVAHIRSLVTPGTPWHAMVQEMFTGQPQEPDVEPESSHMHSQNSVQISSPNCDSSGTFHWTIPIQVSMRLGVDAPGQPQVLPHSAQSLQDRIGSSVRRVEAPTSADAPLLLAALRELKAAQELPYYDANSDASDADTYYQQIDATVAANVFFRVLSEHLAHTHRQIFSYRPSQHLYPWIDLHPDLRLRSIYSGQDFDPELVIREDFRVEAERAIRMQEFLSREHAPSAEQLAAQLDLTESLLPYNCEHVVPQSWFGKRQPMRGDLHHLFTCEFRCNSFRGNCPYIDFPDFSEAIMDQCGKREGGDFEPLHGKGIVARAVLYFLLRYPGMIGDGPGEMPMDRIATLLDWHRQQPPSLYEYHRNSAIYAKQGNRNPFIDRPDWIDRIAFA